ncbi:hypothetical protein PVAP13_5NG100800 [Panicum virgatum]|uniref:GDSL esterase/lipase n=1 Tax=Panicum virgatum TaxID=38727 RepID=A0A8T0RMQ9_PANVG|nr:hypothetical protein PVAP13_5NG100800 [Panicum virgatum]KAG2586149.1 hypothetical protein PVAP13_5NG100800 [Panicum virgatum]
MAAPPTGDWPSISSSFRRGANFAVGGATALERAFFVDKGFEAVCPFNVSLSVQLGWFDALKPSLCSSPRACKEYLAEALFVVGELGWNDYAVMLLAGKSVDEAGSHVPEIVGSICAATEKLIKEGGKTVVVSGIPPLGCAPANLEVMANQTGGEYDPGTGCLRGLNQLSKDHNAQLRGALARLGGALARLGGRSPAGVRVVYADLYSPIIDFAAAPGRYGFEGTLRACCSGGGGGRYNVDHAALCGMPGRA